MRFKTPALLFNVNCEQGARARRLFINRSKIQRSSINQYYPERLLSVVGALIVKGNFMHNRHPIEKKVQIFFKDKLNCKYQKIG
jgi:hypothetical protein